MLKKKSNKPTVWAIFWLTLALAAAVGIVYAGSRTLTFTENWSGADRVPQVSPLEGAQAPLEVESARVDRQGEKVIVTVRSVHTDKHPAFNLNEIIGVVIHPEDESDAARVYRAFRITPSGLIFDLSTGRFSGSNTVMILLSVYFLGVTAILAAAFRKQLKYSIFSYNTAIYLGFGIYLLFFTLLFLSTAVRVVTAPLEVDMYHVYYLMRNSARIYLTALSPLMLLFALALFLSNGVLIRHEGRRFTNYFAGFLGLAMIFGEAAVIALDRYSAAHWYGRAAAVAVNAFTAVILYFQCMLAGMAGASLIASNHTPARDKDYLIILGCMMRKDGTPTPLLAGRINAAKDFCRRQEEETGICPRIICSGGQGDNEPISEALCMKNYLLTQGIPEERILLEEQSRNTWENFRYSGELIGDETKKSAFFTTKYHVFRSGIWARRAGMPRSIEGGGAPTKWYFWPNAVTREFVGLFHGHFLKQLLLLTGTVVLYVLLSLI